MPKYEEPWAQLREFCLCLAVGRLPLEVIGALATARALAGDRAEAKVDLLEAGMLPDLFFHLLR